MWSQQTVEHHQQRPAQAEGQHGTTSGASIDALADKQGTKGHQEGKWYETFLNHTPDWFVAIFTGLLAFITYRLVTTTGDLRVSTDRLWKATIDADEARARETEILQRAYISVEPKGIHPSTEPSAGVTHIEICNVGNLPARNVKWVIKHRRNNDSRWSVPKAETQEATGSITLSPGSRTRQGGPIVHVGTPPVMAVPTPAEMIGKPKDVLGAYLYVWGAVFYEDGFGKQRTTRFCHRYNLARLEAAERRAARIRAKYARYHRDGNDAD